MSAARVVTVGADYLGGAEDAAGREVARAILAEGLPVASRAVVDEDEAALEAVLHAPAEGVRLTVVLARPGGSAGEIVRRVVARVAGARLVLSERLLDLIEADFAGRGQAMPRRHDRLALLPQGAQIWPAPGGEPGWSLETPRGLIAVLPLGSAHVAGLIEAHVRPAARDGAGVCARTLKTVGLSAADCEERLGAWLGKEGGVQVACVPAEGEVWVRLVARAPARALAEAAVADVEAAVRRALGADCFGADEDTLEGVIGRLLAARGVRVSVAEACTGGLLASRLTRDPGASRFLDRAVVAYSNEAKTELLGVSEALLTAHGAVSEPVTRAMASAVRGVDPAAWGLAATGICGPDGGTSGKPVGTVWVAAASAAGVEARRVRLAGGREGIRGQACQAVLDLFRRALLA